ncbi:CBU_0592 family membrane protein [Mucilaginibacter sp.]|uniref:CBU_0592 family membrane protein n=1 Tax=Mucilaginibacter sp. TaxID=1882438 RepID=UPI002ED19D76
MIFISIGWLGVVFCTLGYLLLSTKVLKADSRIFQAFNIFGGLCLAATAINARDLPNAAANVLWMFIGMYALGRQLRNR